MLQASESAKLYEHALSKIKEAGLEETAPLLLSVQLNYSVLMSEIKLNDGEAFIRASETFTKAVQLLPPSRADHDETMMIL
jgi:hypothetical protein